MKVKVPIRCNFRLYVVLIKWSNRKNNFRETTRHSQTMERSLRGFQILLQEIATNIDWMWSSAGRSIFRWPTGLIGKSRQKDLFLPTSRTHLFCQNLPSHTLCNCVEVFPIFNSFCNVWCSKFQQGSHDNLCRWDDLFSQNEIIVSPKTCRSAPTLHRPFRSKHY